MAVAAAALLVSGCGESQADKDRKTAKPIDKAFVTVSIMLNERGAELAQTLRKETRSPMMKMITASMIKSRNDELERLKKLAAQIGADAEGDTPTAGDLKALGWSAADLHLDANAEALNKLGATDAAFLRLMEQNGEGAMRAARPEIVKSALKPGVDLARDIISNRSLEQDELDQQKK